MPTMKHVKTSFTGGELSTGHYGRTDTRAYEAGAARLRNVIVAPQGGVRRRPGMRYIMSAFGFGRLVDFEFNTEQVYLLAFADTLMQVYKDGIFQTQIAVPWVEGDLPQISWTQSADTLLICHPNYAPRKITRLSHTSWMLSSMSFQTANVAGGTRILQPHFKFADPAVTLTATGTSGSITLTCSIPHFQPGHAGTRFRIQNKEVEILVPGVGGFNATAHVKEVLTGVGPFTEWTEQAFSAVRGWPVSVCFHQDRLAIGGSRDLPNRLWLSKSSDLFNFDLGSGLADDAIEFPILSDQVNAIRAVFSGRDLQVLTSGSEWRVDGSPLTPTSIQVLRQTRVGSPADRWVPPVDIDGATIFVQRYGDGVREFLYSEATVTPTYEALEMSLLSRHLLERVRGMAYDGANRLLYCVNSDGTVAVCTVYRGEEVTAWTLIETAGLVVDVAAVGDQVYFLVNREGAYSIEIADPTTGSDCNFVLSNPTPKTNWTGLSYLEGRDVVVLANTGQWWPLTVSGGAINTPVAVSSVVVGLPFTHEIVPLPLPPIAGQNATAGQRQRLIRATMLMRDSASIKLDTGFGLTRDAWPGGVIVDPAAIQVGGCGWRSTRESLWRIADDAPYLMTLLSVETEAVVND